MALSLDIAPTLLEMAGLQPGAEIQGRSLEARAEKGGTGLAPVVSHRVLTDTVFPRVQNMGYVAVRTTRHKYINYRELKGMNELYDLDNDPSEETNLIDRREARDTLQQMQTELRRLIKQTGYARSPAGVSSVPFR